MIPNLPTHLSALMREPLLENVNATLTFDVISTASGQDADGNPITITEVLSFEAIIQPNNIKDAYFEGSDRKVLLVRGRLVTPLVFPSSIAHLSRGTAVIGGKSGGLTLHLLSVNPYEQAQLGQEFEGVFNEN